MRLGLWWSSQRRRRRISVWRAQQETDNHHDIKAYFTIYTVTERIASILRIDIDRILEFTAIAASSVCHSESGNREQEWPFIQTGESY